MGIVIARIGDGGEAGLGNYRRQHLARHIKQRPNDPHPFNLGDRVHASQAFKAAAMRHPHQHGFRLVVAVMGGQQRGRAVRAHGLADQPVPRLPRRCLHTGGGLDAVPAQTAGREAQALGRGDDKLHFCGGLGAEPMVDAVDDQAW